MSSVLFKFEFPLWQKTLNKFRVKDDVFIPFAPKNSAERKKFDKFLMFSRMWS